MRAAGTREDITASRFKTSLQRTNWWRDYVSPRSVIMAWDSV